MLRLDLLDGCIERSRIAAAVPLALHVRFTRITPYTRLRYGFVTPHAAVDRFARSVCCHCLPLPFALPFVHLVTVGYVTFRLGCVCAMPVTFTARYVAFVTR